MVIMQGRPRLVRRTMIASDGTVVEFDEGSGNVFADIGLPNPELLLLKAKLVYEIQQVLADRKLTHKRAARLIGIDQPKLVSLLCGRMQHYTIDRLIRFLNALGQEVEITVRSVKSQSR
jgi:predicted XRE-type DNA-binding protein